MADMSLDHALEYLNYIINSQFCIWRLIRNDDKIKVLISITAINDELTDISTVNEDKEKMFGVSAILYITKPANRAYNIYHCFLILNTTNQYSFSCNLKFDRLPIENLYFLTFSNLKMLDVDNYPDQDKETIPNYELFNPNIKDFYRIVEDTSTVTQVLNVAPGVWWSLDNGCIYLLQLKDEMKAFCPNFGKRYYLNNILCALTEKGKKCLSCRYTTHVDAINCLWYKDGTSDTCVCSVPCGMAKAGLTKLSVTGVKSFCGALFPENNVTNIIFKHAFGEQPITMNISDLIEGQTSDKKIIQADDENFELIQFTPFMSMAIKCGCYELKRLMEDKLQ